MYAIAGTTSILKPSEEMNSRVLTHLVESWLLHGLPYPLHVTHTHNTLSTPRTNEQGIVKTMDAKHTV